MKRSLRAAGIACNDAIFGLTDSGQMTAAKLAAYLRHLPEGISELYCHPATGPRCGDALPRHYRCEDEAAALIDPAVIALVKANGILLTPFAGVARAVP
jgi:hypothetical protein